MENSTDSMSETDYKSLVNQCFEICSTLKDKGCKFSLSLKLGSSFNFSLSSEGCSPEATQRPRRRSPSYLRRQTLRRAAFLERKKKLPLAEETASTGNDNNVCRQGGSDLLDKKVASSGQTAQKEDVAVDKDCPLNLNPTPSYPRESVESVETEDSIENVFDSKSNQVNDNGKFKRPPHNPLVNPAGQFKITVPCDRCRQSEVTRWWNPPTIWPPVQPIRCAPCSREIEDWAEFSISPESISQKYKYKA